ncbi:class I SAM-dependent methyltransferase [Kiloniella sp.]|uniref:class I SAM-dependent methyltransferase n=1 Tax=Kiloniella sp. TaxID=1938587 RepID=UPI003A8F6648
MKEEYLDQSEFTYIMWLYKVFEKVQHVPGHIVEVGVAEGRNSIIFGRLIEAYRQENVRNYYGFDTFSGFTDEDLENNSYLPKNRYDHLSLNFVKKRIQDQNLTHICQFIEGDIRKTANEFIASSKYYVRSPGYLRIALLYIDCNAYGASLESMRLFKNHMMPGGIICIDEKKQGGETEALIQFCSENNLKIMRDVGPFSIPAYTTIDHQ